MPSIYKAQEALERLRNKHRRHVDRAHTLVANAVDYLSLDCSWDQLREAVDLMHRASRLSRARKRLKRRIEQTQLAGR